MNMIRRLSVTTAAGVLLLSGLFTGGAAASVSPQAGPPDSVGTLAERSFECGGGSTDRLNFSWNNGNTSTRIYYNNHCNGVRYVTVVIDGPAGTRNECWRVPQGKGSKLFSKALLESVRTITRYC
ncbi:hypothetical protein [Marinactinospora rubrisoli]|uniref:Uncharacterized protein n=1 Tax=Marinactinospora rubrisoli TaxID=2715399 RepID=A0ABW2KIP9_9ACTN